MLAISNENLSHRHLAQHHLVREGGLKSPFTFSLIPNLVTIHSDILVALSKSLEAPKI